MVHLVYLISYPRSLIICHTRIGLLPASSSRRTPPTTRLESGSTLARLHARHTLLTALFFLCCLLFLFTQHRPSSSLFNDIDKFKTRFQLTPSTRNATMSAGINAVRIPAKSNATAAVIWLHGLGDQGRGWSFISQYYNISVAPCLQDLLICSMSR